MIEKFNPPTVHEPTGYSHVTISSAGRLAHLAGQCPLGLSGEVVGHSHDNGGPAVVDRYQGRDPASQALFHAIDFATQPLGIEALDHLAEESVTADLLRPGRLGLGSARHRQRFPGVGQLSLEPAPFIDERGNTRRDLVGRRL